jgi:peroxiredoxin
VNVVGVSADPPEVNEKFRKKHGLPFPVLSDTHARITGPLRIPTSTKHPMAMMRGYPNGFMQPAFFLFDSEGGKKFEWIQNPKVKNLFGATKRMTPEEILEKSKEVVGNGPKS